MERDLTTMDVTQDEIKAYQNQAFLKLVND